MQSSVISKIEKARRYAEEKTRVNITSMDTTFKGDHRIHTVSYHDGAWTCSCSFFTDHEMCGHTMALQRIMYPMLVT